MKAHSQIVNAIDGVGGLGIGEGAPEIVTASRDGKMLESINFYYINWGALLGFSPLRKMVSPHVKNADNFSGQCLR